MIKKILLPLFIALISISMSHAHAEIECLRSEKTNLQFSQHSGGPGLGTTSTGGTLLSLVGTGSQLTGNTTYEILNKCAALKAQEIGNQSGVNIELGDGCSEIDEELCTNLGLFNAIEETQTGYKVPGGSLMGIATALERGLQEPLPVNLAFYVNQNAKKIPGIKSTAFAQDTIEYGGPFLGAIYHYWTISRNIAYAFLAAAMTVIGIMIIMGKSIDPKAGVTVQQALPQIIIALILITFSYPIGAAGASLAFNIRGNMDTWTLLDDANKLDVATVSMIGFLGSIQGLGTGFVALLGSIAAAIVSLVMGLLVLFKIFGIYLKMLFAIITAPVSFAIGAIPGNQDTTTNWFKQFGAYMISLPAMSFGALLVFGLIGDIGLRAFTSFEEFGGFWLGVLGGAAIPVITFFGYTMILTIPEKIEGMFGIKGGK